MAENKLPFAEGASIHKPPMFSGVNYQFWKVRMKIVYLTASRPYFMFNVCLYIRYQANPKESYYMTAKRILKYLKGTIDIGLWYPSDVSLNLIGYHDSYFVGCKIDRKSTSGTCHLLGSSLISWHSKKQA